MVIKVAMPRQFQFRVVSTLPNLLRSRENEIHYIGGCEVLPPPLSAVQEAKALESLETERGSEARTTLIEHNLRLVVYIAKKFENT